jgi:ribonuclease HII
MVVGIDEVGRGPWAGPLVFSAVVLGGATIDGLTDSKKLTKKKREALDILIREQAVAFGLGWVSAEELDEIGMSAACTLACRRALEQIAVPYSEIIIDGVVNFLKDTGKGPYVTTMKQADLLVPSVSAASILAKVARDRFMEEQDALYPGYGFASHVGYGTKQHMDALKLMGVTPLHRTSVAPIVKLLSNEIVKVPKKSIEGTTRATGNASEDAAAAYLQKLGYVIVERNWKTRMCEIDIVAKKNEILYFVEVKHRKTDQQGGGIAAITPKKLDQMKFATKVYAHYIKQDDADMYLGVITTQGTDFAIVDFMTIDQ